jgi:hypothetical protein
LTVPPAHYMLALFIILKCCFYPQRAHGNP